MSDHKVPWAPGRYAMVRSYNVWVQCVGAPAGEHYDMMGNRSAADLWVSVEDYGEELATADGYALPSQCPRCYELEGHTDGCMVAANLARGVWPWLAPFVMTAPPPKCDLELEIFQVYPHGLDTMIDVSNAGEPADWRVNAADPDEDRPGQFALGWVALGPDGPTLAPWSAVTAPETS